MRIVCSWCRGEGQIGLVGEKAPLEDRRETHGICVTHRIAVQARWKEGVCGPEGRSPQFVSVGTESELSSSAVSGHYVLSVAHLWVGLRNLTRRARF